MTKIGIRTACDALKAETKNSGESERILRETVLWV